MADVSRSTPKIIDDLTELFELQDDAEVRLRQARAAQPVAWALVMAALCWDQVDRRGWRTAKILGAQARRLMAAWKMRAEPVDDVDQVSPALAWATQNPALLERDDQGRYRPVFGVAFPVGSRAWRELHRAAVACDVLTPLELVDKGDTERDANPADVDAAEASYRLVVDSDDPDAAALAALRLAELAESREQPEEAARRYAGVTELRHPLASPPAVLWQARRAFENGDRETARVLAHEVTTTGGNESLRSAAWGVLGSLAWLDDDTDAAVAALRQAVAAAGEWHWSYSRHLAEMLAASGDLAGAADTYRTLLDQPLLHAPDAGRYVELMVAAGRTDEAVAVLEEHATDSSPFSGDMLLALASLHATRDDLDAYRQTLARVRAHWSAMLPQVSVRADVMEASVATAEGDDDRAARLFRSLTDTDDAERRDLARPLLITAGERFAKEGKLCVIPGVRPLLEYLSEVAPPDTASWAATSLAHLATLENRPADAEAAIALAARHLDAEEVTVLRAMLLFRTNRGRDALAFLIDAIVAAPPSAMPGLLPTLTLFGMHRLWPNSSQRRRLRAAVDYALFASDSDGAGDSDGSGRAGDVDGDGGNGTRERVAMIMAQVELYSCNDRDRAIALWEIAAAGHNPAVTTLAWYNLGLMRQWLAPISAAHAYEQAMLAGDTPISACAAIELARLAERLEDDIVLARACERVLDLTSGDDWAHAALRLGRLNQDDHPDDVEDAYHAALTEPGVSPATIGATLARLGALYSRHGNRRLAQRIWRRGRNHRDPHVAKAFAVERAKIGRVTRISR